VAEEIDECTPFLREQIRIISPEVIVTMGNFATKFVLKTTTGITRLRGTVQQAGAFTVLPIFHPAAALYDRTKVEVLEKDFALLGELLWKPQAKDSGPSGDAGPPKSEAEIGGTEDSGADNAASDAPGPEPVQGTLFEG
jgi:DNA polymerase